MHNRFKKLDRIRVFNDTKKKIKRDNELSNSISEAKEKTTVYLENNYPKYNCSKQYDTVIKCSKERSFEAAMRLYNEDNSRKIAVLNFANAFFPGGAVRAGANAQEECLCRISTLYPILKTKYLKKIFYDYHRNLKNPDASDRLVYTEGVVIFKDDVDSPTELPKNEWAKVDIITMAAPDLRTHLGNKNNTKDDESLKKLHIKRAEHMLTCAASKGADTLVLGAFGCGIFRNDPKVVAEAYREALDKFPKVFKKIEFAVYASENDDKNYKAFESVFG